MVNAGANPVDYSTTVGQVRALLGDDDGVALDPPVVGQAEYAWYSDAAISGLLVVYGDSPKRAAAQALRTVASSQALILKKFSTDDLHVDGPAIAEALRKLAADLDRQADAGEDAVDIFEISYPGQNVELIPEGLPAQLGHRWGRIATYGSGSAWHLDGDGYIVDD